MANFIEATDRLSRDLATIEGQLNTYGDRRALTVIDPAAGDKQLSKASASMVGKVNSDVTNYAVYVLRQKGAVNPSANPTSPTVG